MRRIIITADDILAELNSGRHYQSHPETKEKLTAAITTLAGIVKAQKLSAPVKVKRTRPAAITMTIEAWEAEHGELISQMMKEWITQKGFCRKSIAILIGEFRTEMQSKGLLYADFVKAFQTYLNKGYLSKKPEQVLLINSPYKTKYADKEFNRGVSL